jgi:hypothetical protein
MLTLRVVDVDVPLPHVAGGAAAVHEYADALPHRGGAEPHGMSPRPGKIVWCGAPARS